MKYALLSLPLMFALGCTSAGPSSDRPALDLTLDDRVAPDSCSAHWVAGVRGRVVDSAGEAVTEGVVQMCLRLENGSQLCQTPGSLRPDGWYTVVLPEETRCVQQVTLRISQLHRAVSTSFYRAPMDPVYGVLDVYDDVVLHPLETPVGRPPVGDSATMRTLSFPSGFEIDVTPASLEFPDVYDDLTVGEVPLSQAPGFVDSAPDLLGIWALGPESAARPGFSLRIPETTGLPDGTRVELWLVGGLYTQLSNGEEIEEGQFAPYGTGTVNGGVIQTDPGSELPYLSWVGYRVAR